MKDVWFKEDRALAKDDKSRTRQQHIQESKKVLLNSTLFRNRLERILKDMIDESLREDEDFSKPNWEREHIANISRRKVLKELLSLINFKED